VERPLKQTLNWKNAAALVLATVVAEVAPAQSTERIKVTATFSILADMAQRVGGDRVEVATLVKRSQDVHVYQPTPTNAARLAKSDVLISNGLTFEGWMERLVSASGFKGQSIVASQGVPALQSALLYNASRDKSTDPQKTGHSHFVTTNPHAWHAVSNAQIYVTNIRDGLCKADAAGCAAYTANAVTYSKELASLDSEIKSKLVTIAQDKRIVITMHDAFGYFGLAYGVKFLAPLGVSTEQDASAKTIANIIDQMKNHSIKAVFVETISDPRLIEQIARETGATVGPPLYAETLSESDGPAATYVEMMRYNANALAQAMAKN
jgi:zinc/manganese transport system substrate-binding protein